MPGWQAGARGTRSLSASPWRPLTLSHQEGGPGEVAVLTHAPAVRKTCDDHDTPPSQFLLLGTRHAGRCGIEVGDFDPYLVGRLRDAQPDPAETVLDRVRHQF